MYTINFKDGKEIKDLNIQEGYLVEINNKYLCLIIKCNLCPIASIGACNGNCCLSKRGFSIALGISNIGFYKGSSHLTNLDVTVDNITKVYGLPNKIKPTNILEIEDRELLWKRKENIFTVLITLLKKNRNIKLLWKCK